MPTSREGLITVSMTVVVSKLPLPELQGSQLDANEHYGIIAQELPPVVSEPDFPA
jgi:hypothetical protein